MPQFRRATYGNGFELSGDFPAVYNRGQDYQVTGYGAGGVYATLHKASTMSVRKQAVQQFRRIATQENPNIQMILPVAETVGLSEEGIGRRVREFLPPGRGESPEVFEQASRLRSSA
jgi:hypothetical protein